MIVPFPPTETKREEIPSASALVSSVKSVSSVSSATEALSFEKSSYQVLMSSLYQYAAPPPAAPTSRIVDDSHEMILKLKKGN